MSKVHAIWTYIKWNSPTRTQLNEHIISVINKREIPFDKYNDRGYYGTNIQQWKRNGHIEVVGKCYCITSESLEDGKGKMYTKLPSNYREMYANEVKRANRYITDSCELRNYKNALKLANAKVRELQEQIQEVKSITSQW